MDFCAVRRKLIIEVDGSPHLDQVDCDSERTDFLESKRYRVLRFWNNEVMNGIDPVLEVIIQELELKNNTNHTLPS